MTPQPIPGLERLVEEMERMILAKVQVMLEGYRPSGLAAARGGGGGGSAGPAGPPGPPGPAGPPGAAAGGETLIEAGECNPAGSIAALLDDLYCKVNGLLGPIPEGFGNGGFGENPFGA